MAKKKVLTSAPGPSDIGVLSPQAKGDKPKSAKDAVAAAVAAAEKANAKELKDRQEAATERAKTAAEELKKWGQAELSRRIVEYTNRYNTLISDIAKRGGVKNPQNATLVDQATKLATQLKDMDSTLVRLQKKEQQRPTGVPADAKFDEKAKQWVRGSDKWDEKGKKVQVTGPTGPTTATTATAAAPKDTTATATKPAPTTPTGPTATTATAPVGPTTAITATTATTATTAFKQDFEKVFQEAVKMYGDIDEIFRTNTELRGILEAAIGKVDDPNDDFTEERFLNTLKGTTWWQSQAGVIRQRGFLKRQYDKLAGKLDKNSPTYAADLEKLNAENEYGRGLDGVKRTLQAQAQGLGADMTEDQLNLLASRIYSLGYEGDVNYVNRALTPFVSTVGLAGGTAGQTLQELRRVARANGFELETRFPQYNEWVRQVINGRNIDDFKNLIREQAAAGQGKYVTDLLRSGYDLDGIYGNYVALMAQAFNIDPTTIKLDDPLLKNIFDDKGGMKFNDFQNLLRSDARFKGTPGMAAEKDLRQSIMDRAKSLGVMLQESDADDIANNILSMGIGASSSLVDGLIRAKFRYAPGIALGGFAGNNLAALKQTAEANGLELDKAFTQTEIQSWLSNILQGETIETYKRRIRQVAKSGLPERVGALLDLGSDLESIYAPYKNVMANVLEISPETIRLNDAVLRQAIGPEKEMSIYEWERFLRKDPRWQYTNQARAEVSDAVRSTFQDFGIMG